METARILLETDEQGVIRDIPALPPSSRIEAILYVPEPSSSESVRKPHPYLAEITVIHGDVEGSVVPPEEWLGEA
ncbi:MAG: hypothetical protein GHCLOJNM_01913 [bacterium]|nr:hypothetical protein [bacterium]